VSSSYILTSAYDNTDGAFAPPATDLALEWGPSASDMRHRGSISFGTAMVRGLTASMSLSGSSDRPLTIRTGVDDNGDLIFNDRPEGVTRNSARVPGQWSSSASFGYTFSLGSRQVNTGGGVSITSAAGAYSVSMSQGQSVPRYRLGLSVNVQNLFNRASYTGYSGVQTSRNFLQPSAATGVRRTTVNLTVSF
jgi:hypothetical protein